MTKIKFCGLSRPCEIAAVNRLKPAYIGFVFAPKSRRYLTPEAAADLKRLLAPGIQTVGVFVNEAPQTVAKLLEDGINSIGLGPQGMGGAMSVLGVHIENTARHPSTIGVAVNVGCLLYTSERGNPPLYLAGS